MSKKAKKAAKTTENNSKTANKHEYILFVKKQGEGGIAIFVVVLKVIELVLTSIFALCLGIFAPLCVWFGLENNSEVSADPAVTFWFISSILYIIGLFAVMLGHLKTAAVIHTLATVGTLLTYYRYSLMYADIPDSNGPTGLFMPCIFITMLTIIMMLLVDIPKSIEKHNRKKNEKAPSIFGDK